MFKNKKTGLFCFSPPIMLATFLIEIILLLLILTKRRFDKNTILVVITLFMLAFFQLCEYFVCGGFGVNGAAWSRLGFIAITTLPPLGIHLIYEIAHKKNRPLIIITYAIMAAWIVLFGFTDRAFSGQTCISNYVIFDLKHYVGYLYSAYYYGLLLIGIMLAMKFGEKSKNKRQKEALFGVIIGYLVFLVPTAVVNTIKPETMAGIPSIMCGFAVLFALLLYAYVLPRVIKTSQ